MTKPLSVRECEQAQRQGREARRKYAAAKGRALPAQRDESVRQTTISTSLVRKAAKIVDRDPELVSFIERHLAANLEGEGRPRELTVRTALICFVLLAITDDNFHLINLPVLMSSLSWRTRRELGIDYRDRRGHPKQVSYQQVLRVFHAISDAFDPLSPELSDEEANERARNLRELSFRMVQASTSLPRSGDVAVDATLKWGWDRPGGLHSKIERRGRDGDAGKALSLSEILDGEEVLFVPDPLAHLRATVKKKERRPSTWGPGSMWAGRANKTKSVYGIALHAVTASAKDSPPVIEAITVTPAPALPAPAVTPLLELLREKRLTKRAPLGEVVADPAYSANPPDWQIPIRHLGGSPIFRLHRHNQAGLDMHSGITFVDGRPYCSCIPDELAEIPFPRFPATRAQLFGYAMKVAKRRRFEMTPNTAFRSDGSRQFRFPHWKPKEHKGGCPACTTNGEPIVDPVTGVRKVTCCSQATKILSEDDLGLYQDVPFGELEWFEKWNRRDRVEGTFGTTKNLEVVNWGHDYHHFVGLVRESVVAIFAAVAHNFHIERSWLAKQTLKPADIVRRVRRKRDEKTPATAEERLVASIPPSRRGPKGLEFLGSPRDGP